MRRQTGTDLLLVHLWSWRHQAIRFVLYTGEKSSNTSDEGNDVDEKEFSRDNVVKESGLEYLPANMEGPDSVRSASDVHSDTSVSNKVSTPVISTGIKGKKYKRSKAVKSD